MTLAMLSNKGCLSFLPLQMVKSLSMAFLQIHPQSSAQQGSHFVSGLPPNANDGQRLQIDSNNPRVIYLCLEKNSLRLLGF